MLKVIDRIFGCLLILGGVGHTIGTIMWTPPMSGIFIWSLGAALAVYLLGALNLIRAGRPNDKALAAITLVGTACWAVLAFTFGKSIHNLLDPRPLSHVIIAIILVIFSAMTLWHSPSSKQANAS